MLDTCLLSSQIGSCFWNTPVWRLAQESKHRQWSYCGLIQSFLVDATSHDHLKAHSHIACRSHTAPMPFPYHAVPLRVYNVSFPFDLHNAAVSDSHLPCRALAYSDHAVLLKATAQHGRRGTTMLCCGLENGMVGAWHGKCESDTAALCK